MLKFNKKIIFLVIFSLSGCSQGDKKPSSLKEIDSLKNQIIILQDQINVIKNTQNNILENELKTFKLYVDLVSAQKKEVSFNPASKGYSVLKSNMGDFVVSLDKLSKYANGYKAIFSIGNPNLVTYSGASITVNWGEPFTPDKDYNLWEKSLISQKFELNNLLLPGVWNKVTIVLSPAKASETGYISLSMEVNKAILSRDLRKEE